MDQGDYGLYDVSSFLCNEEAAAAPLMEDLRSEVIRGAQKIFSRQRDLTGMHDEVINLARGILP